MTDNVENYLVLVDGKKTYTCSLCNFTTKRLPDMRSHLLAKKHITNLANKPAEPIMVPVRIAVAEEDPPKNSPPKNRIKGKTYLSQYCNDAVRIDTLGFPWGRTFEITVDDIKRWIVMTPSQYIEYIFLKIIKQISVDKFPFRCLDKARLKFYYNDNNLGWIEDLGNIETHKLIRSVLGKSTSTASEMRRLTTEIDDEITMENLTYVMFLYNWWALPYSSVQEPERNKTEGGAKKENVSALNYLADLLDCE